MYVKIPSHVLLFSGLHCCIFSSVILVLLLLCGNDELNSGLSVDKKVTTTKKVMSGKCKHGGSSPDSTHIADPECIFSFCDKPIQEKIC